MVYLLHAYFGRDGREEAEELLQRNSGSDDSPAHPRRVQRGDAGLAVVLHVHLLHRPGRQVPARHAEGVGVRPAVAAPASSCSRRRRTTCSWAPPASTGWCERTAELMREHDTDDVAAARRHPARRDPEVPQLPLLGVARPVRLARPRPTPPTTSPPGSRAAGRRSGARTTTGSPTTPIDGRRRSVDGAIGHDRGRRRWSALNTDLRREYIADCQSGVNRWNRILEQAGLDRSG